MKLTGYVGLATLMLTLMGCGGGNGGNNADGITRELLAGTTEKTWFITDIRGNATYAGGGVDAPCPASLKKTSDARISFSCEAGESIVLRESGTAIYRGVSGTSWKLGGSTLTLDAGSLGILTGTIIDESVPGESLHRLRVRLVSRVVNGVRNTDDDGCELVIEDGLKA